MPLKVSALVLTIRILCTLCLAVLIQGCFIFGAQESDGTAAGNHRVNTLRPDSLPPADYSHEPTTPREEQYFDDFIWNNAPSDSAFIAAQRLAAPLIRAKKFAKAAELYERYAPLFPNRHQSFKAIRALLLDTVQHYYVHNMGSAFNTPGDEFMPVPAMRDYPLRLFFTGAHRNDARMNEEVYYAECDVVRWKTARVFAAPFGQYTGESPTSLSENGTQLLFYRNMAMRGMPDYSRVDKDTAQLPWDVADSTLTVMRNRIQSQKGKLFFSNGRFLTWRQITEYPAPVNSAFFDGDAQVVSGGKVLLFVSDRPGGIGERVSKPRPGDSEYHGDRWGNTDIYVSIRTPEGWSKPINLGSVINTPYAERSPYLSTDGKTLYFSSDGHPGLGRMDVFRSERKNPESWTEWTEPENLGKEVNSGDDDWGLKEGFDTDSIFFASRNRADGFGGLDIYSGRLAPPPPRMTVVRGLIRDYYNKPLVADIRFMDATDDPYYQRTQSDSNGMFEMRLPRGRDYIWISRKEGYYPITKNFRLKGSDADSVLDSLDMTLVPMHDNPNLDTAVLHVENILFEYNSVAVQDKYVTQLQAIVEYMKNKSTLNIEITGHTDSEGAVEYNRNLSRRRADAVRKFLVQLGCEPHRLNIAGVGYEHPLGNNDTEEGRALNRRVEIRLKY